MHAFPSSFSLHARSSAFWGINSEDMQFIMELTGEFHAQAEPKLTATLDFEKMNFKFKSSPIRQQYELLRIR